MEKSNSRRDENYRFRGENSVILVEISTNSEIIAVEWFGELTIHEGDPLALGLRNSICNSFKVVFISSFGVSG